MLARAAVEPGKADEREMPKRRHSAPLHDAHAAVPRPQSWLYALLARPGRE